MKAILYTFFVLTVVSCSSSTSDFKSQTTGDPQEDTVAKSQLPSGLCIWKEVAVRETPSEKGKYLTSVSLGEKFEVSADTASETVNGKKSVYHLIKLSDGTTGWVRETFIAINAKAGAFTQDAVLYKRPDLMTASKKSFNYLDFVAIKGSNNDGWSEVIGKRKGDTWFSTGWVRTETLTTLEVDVHFSALYNVIMEIPEEVQRQEELDKLFLSDMLAESVFHQQNGDNAEDFVETEYSEEPDTTTVNQ
ncbi:MAG TPA: SH3 domain-containing protein [Chryseosolibacter sp.]